MAVGLILAESNSVIAGEISPLSPLYAPATGQVLLTSAISTENTRAQLQSPVLSHDGNTHYGLMSQTLDYGITKQLTASVTEVYAKAFERNSFNPAEGRVGFRSPKFQLSSWTPLADRWTLKPSIGLQFNPANQSKLNYAQLAGDLIHQPVPSQVLLVGLIYTAHKDIGSHSHGWRSEWGSTWGSYQLRLKYAKGHLAGFGGAQGRFSPSDYSSWELETGRALSSDFWGSLSFASERSAFQWSQLPTQMPVSSQNHLRRLSANLKWSWP